MFEERLKKLEAYVAPLHRKHGDPIGDLKNHQAQNTDVNAGSYEGKGIHTRGKGEDTHDDEGGRCQAKECVVLANATAKLTTQCQGSMDATAPQ